MITAQYAKGHGGTYRYYRCTKRLGTCSQKYLREDLLVGQLKEEILKIALCEDWKEKMIAQVLIWEKEANKSSHNFAQNLDEKIKVVEIKLDKLVNNFLDGIIEKETYLKKKNELVEMKMKLSEQKKDFGRKGNQPIMWIEPLKEWIETASKPVELQGSTDFLQIKAFVQKIGTNHQMNNKKINFEIKNPYQLVRKYRSSCELSRNGGRLSSPAKCQKIKSCSAWYARRDSNPRPTGPKPVALTIISF